MILRFLLLTFALNASQYGPDHGSLVIVGGGAVGPEIWQRFIALAGGPDSPVVYIPAASETEPKDNAGDFLKRAGFTDVTVIHTRDKKVADTDEFVAPLKRAKAVWFGGGRQWRIVDSYEGTRTEREFQDVLNRGGVIGGTSAGATIQGSYLVRGSKTGNEIMMAPGYERGFGYLRNAAIDQHLIKRKRENDLWEVISKYPQLLGIGLDEGTAIVVQQDRFDVLGVSKVAIYDARHKARPNEPRHYFLEIGDTFDMIARQKVELKLQLAWTYDTRDSLEAAKGGGTTPALEVTPVYSKGRLYISTPWGTVAALESTTGKELWRINLNINPKGSYGDFASRGLTLHNDRLYTGTVDGRLVCLEAKDGKRCPSFGNQGEIDLTKGLRRNPQWVGEYEVTSPPAIFSDLVITGSAIADNSRFDMASGEVRAFDLNTGALRWTFHPLGENSQAGGANTWSRIVADESTGLVFLPVGSASPDYYGARRPGDNRHANSLVALDGKTGKLVWSFQTVHHDIWDYDVASPPELYEHKGVKAIATGSKTGHLFLLDRLTGKPIFGVEERKVPQSDVAGESSSPTQPFPLKPAPLVRHSIGENDIQAADPKDREACITTLKSLRNEGVFTPPSQRGTLVVPGNIGGMHWGGLTWAKKDGILVAPVNDLPAIITLIPKSNFRDEKAKFPDRETTEQKGTDFAMSRRFFLAPSGKPCVAPPWGSLVGIKADTGEIAWKTQLGDWPNLGGPTISSKGFVFIGAEFSPFLRAFNPSTGQQLGQWQLPTSARATPMTFIEDGKEYVVIAAGGHNASMSKLDTKLVAFRID